MTKAKVKPLHYTLRKWHLLSLDGDEIWLRGCIDNSGTIWKNVAVVKRIDQNTIQATSGTVYQLDGPMDREMSQICGVPSEIVRIFDSGFPYRWRNILINKKHLLNFCNTGKFDVICKAKNITFNKHRMLTRSKTVSTDSLLSFNSGKSLQLIHLLAKKRQPSTELCNVPICPNTLIITKQPIVVLQCLETCEQNVHNMLCTRIEKLISKCSENALNSQRKTDVDDKTNSSKAKLVEHRDSSQCDNLAIKKIQPKRACKETINMKQVDNKVVFESHERKRKRNVTRNDSGTMSSSLNTNPFVSIQQQTVIKKPVAVVAPYSLGNDLKQNENSTDSNPPASHVEVAEKTKSNSRGKKTSNGNLSKENAFPKSANVVLTAKKGTLKRRKQIANLLKHVAEKHEDDFYQSTPFRNKKQCFDMSPLSNTGPKEVIPFQTPRFLPPSLKPLTIERTKQTPSRTSDVIPDVERYLYRRNKWQKERVKKSKVDKLGAISRQKNKDISHGVDSEDFFQMLRTGEHVEGKDDDDQEEEDYYFSCE